jgi:hypothetical protein
LAFLCCWICLYITDVFQPSWNLPTKCQKHPFLHIVTPKISPDIFKWHLGKGRVTVS